MPFIFIDVTQFIRAPLRTGIQRVVRQILSHWPNDVPKKTICYDQASNNFFHIPDMILDYVLGMSVNPYYVELEVLENLQTMTRELEFKEALIKQGDTIFCPELFVDRHRSEKYATVAANGTRVAMIIYDFIPWLEPDSVGIVLTSGLNWYLTSAASATKRCFISAKVKRDFEKHIVRHPVDADPVLPLGADGFGEPRNLQLTSDRASSIVCFGALDGRKGQDLVFDAFLQSSAATQSKLVFAGRIPPQPSPRLNALLSYSGSNVEIIADPDDHTVADMIRQARAMVFASRQEGFGLPALESLWLGTPVMIDANLPAVEGLPALGQIRLDPADITNLINGFSTLSNDNEVARLRREIPGLKLLDWKSYTISLADWVCD